MGDKVCPNCGNTLTDTDSSCPCGYSLQDDDGAVPSPGIVRSTGPRAVATATKAVRDRKSAKASGGAVARPNEALIIGCPSCAARISRRAPECPKCGASPFDHCQVCAARVLANTTPCPECGDPDPFGAESD